MPFDHTPGFEDAEPPPYAGKANGRAGVEAKSSLNSLNSLPAGWPKPLATAAYHGLAGEVVRIILPHTEADPVAILVQFLCAFGNAVGRGPYFAVEGDQHTTNIFAALVGETAKGRKGTSWGRVRQLMEDADPDWSRRRVVQGLSSGEGLIWEVRDPIEKTQRDKKTGESRTEVVDEGTSDKRLLVLEAEFASVLRVMAREGSILSAIIRQAWDRGDLRTLVKNNPACATAALISIIGHITADELRRYLDRTESANGFANRFLFPCVRRSKCLPDGGGEIDLSEISLKITEALTKARLIGQMRRGAEARALWHEVYPELSEGKPGLLGAVVGRAEAQVTRLALLYALLDGRAEVGRDHLAAALELWRYCEDSARYVFGRSVGDPVADAILTALRQAGRPMSRTEISEALGRNVPASQIERALATLAAAGLVAAALKDTGGKRPAEMWSTVQ